MLGLGAPVQIAYAVDDVDAAALRWTSQYGAGPFFLRRHIELRAVRYRGATAVFDHSSAYGQWGSVMVELVQDHTDGPSVFNEHLGAGLHHLAFFVDEPESTLHTLAERGYETAMSASTAGGSVFHFVDTVADLGHYLEIYRSGDRLREFYSMVADAALGWDGSRPIRE